jgi:protein SMG9
MKILPSAKSATPSRIAAGEDGKAKQPPAARVEPELVLHKLLNANLELSTEELQRHLADQSDFTVIGVLGCQGAGKSTVMSLLAGADWRSDEREPGRLRDPPFAPQTLETLLQGSHQTVGVDVTVTQERLILLDTQPLLSPSVLVELLRKESLPQEAHSAENLAELHSLRMAMLLLSVCHMVLTLTPTLALTLALTLAQGLTLSLTLTTDH